MTTLRRICVAGLLVAVLAACSGGASAPTPVPNSAPGAATPATGATTPATGGTAPATNGGSGYPYPNP